MPLYALGKVEPDIHPNAWVAPDATIIGNVKLEDGASVWFGAVLRGDNEPIAIGKGANVQDNCCLHTDPGYPLTVGAGATVGHGTILHGCKIGTNALVGMGSTVLNGASVGDSSILGANSLLAEGKAVPDRMLAVGAPARIIRELDNTAAQVLKASGKHYVANAKVFKAGMRRIDG